MVMYVQWFHFYNMEIIISGWNYMIIQECFFISNPSPMRKQNLYKDHAFLYKNIFNFQIKPHKETKSL